MNNKLSYLFFTKNQDNMKMCSHCNGYGSSLKEKEERCSKCGGSGLINKSCDLSNGGTNVNKV